MLKKKQFVFYKLIYKKNKKLNSPSFYSIGKLKKLFKHHQSKLISNKQYDFFTQQSLFSSMSRTNSQRFVRFSHEVAEVEDKENFSFRGLNNNFKLLEVKISRIQFKPGYQRL
jgi:hypothetical protein